MKYIFMLLGVICLGTFEVKAHCEIPCGIYDDSVRIKLLYEHITTMEKSMQEIVSLQKSAQPDYHMISRWTTNKEEHANKFQEIVSQYFLHQRIKPVDKNQAHDYAHYLEKLELLHRLSVEAMKAKQTLDMSHIQAMRKLLGEFERAYFNHHH